MVRRVVIIDDADVTAELAATLLSEFGGCHAETVVDRFERLLERPFWEKAEADAALIDYALGGPVLGSQVAEFLQSEFPEVRRVLWTAQGSGLPPISDATYAAIVFKPFNIDELFRALDIAVGGSSV